MNLLPFIAALEDKDEKFFEIMKGMQELVYGPSALDMKTKLMLCLAVDATVGADDGVKNIAKILRNMGTTDEEIAEVLRITYFTKGNSTLHTALSAYKE